MNDTYKQATAFLYDKIVTILFGKKPDFLEKFKPTFESEEITKELISFFNNRLVKTLVIGVNANNVCIIVRGKESKFSRKAVLILKVNREDGFHPDMEKNFLFIEVAKNVFDQVKTICSEVFYPILSQSVYRADSSELISKDLMEKFHNFLAHYQVASGHIKNQIILPIPSDEIFKNDKINDNEKTQLCEGAVVMWIELIKHILKQEPENAFRNSMMKDVNSQPSPSSEIEFWKKKSDNLISITNQIKGEKINDVLKFLEKQKSTYHKFFNDIKKEVSMKEKEATQNYTFLSFLAEEFSELNSDSTLPEDLAFLFVPIFHTVRMIWRDNEFYNRPERLIILIKKLCNSLIKQSTINIGSKTIFEKISNKETVSDAISKLEMTREIINKFISAYFYFKDSNTDGWKITRNVIFFKLDAFNDRVGDILNVAKSYAEFCKMEEKQIGGIRGQQMIDVLNAIYKECTNAVKDIQKDVREDVMLDINSDVFNKKYMVYKETLKELERRVAAVLNQCFDDVDTILGKFKVLEVFDTILERPNIVIELEKKYNYLLELFKNELRTVQFLFLTGKDFIDTNDERSPLNKSMPPIAATLYWTDSLKERIREPFERFTLIGKRITEKEEFREIEILYHSIYKLIIDYENSKKKKWDENSRLNSGEKQKEFILKKVDDYLTINFDPALLQLLKEIKYLKILNLSIPQEAETVYKKNNEFRKQISNLENIITSYNNMVSSLHPVEKPLIDDKLIKLVKIIEPGLNQITWESTDLIQDFVKKASEAIADLVGIVDKLKGFVFKVEEVLTVWKGKMLFTRPNLSSLDEMSNKFTATFDAERSVMVTKSKEISNLNDVLNALKSVISNISQFKESEKWKNYQHYINSIIINGFTEIIYNNLEFLHKSLDYSREPICSVQLDLEDRKLAFFPLLDGDETKQNTLKQIILRWINQFLNLGTVNKNRVDIGSGDYMLEILENFRIQEIIYRLYDEVNGLIQECYNIVNDFGDFKILWEKDFEEAFEEFLKAHPPKIDDSPETEEKNEKIRKIFPQGNPLLKGGVKENTPSKEYFDDKINEFMVMLKRVKSMEENVKIRWIQVSYTMFKNKLEGIINNWIGKYKFFLKENSSNKLKNIDDFMKEVQLGISYTANQISDEDSRKKFFNVLEKIQNMKALQHKIKDIIPTIIGELEVLKKYSRTGEEEEDENEEKEQNSEEQKQINRTEFIGKELVRLSKEVEEKNTLFNPLIEEESGNFKKVLKKFEEKVNNFREEFIKKVPSKLEEFSLNEIENSYKILDQYYAKVQELEFQRKENNNMEILLNLQVSQSKPINDCLNDLQQLKVLWDYCSLYFNTFENWKKQKMEKVNINDLVDKIEVMKNMLKKNPVRKDIKNHPIFLSLSKKIEDMDNTINVTLVLKDRVIKSRHWKHLNEVTGKTIPYDSSDFSIDHIINLGLFNFKEKIEEEKGNALAQEKMETEFNKIEKFWKIQKFRMTKNLNNKQYDLNLFDHSLMEISIESLEKDQNALINMLQKKSVLENFDGMDEKISKYKDKLSVVNKVMKIWLKFQKNWEKLETIFMKSEDIQKTLPKEYRKFKELDIKFKDEMKNAYDYDTMIDSCTEDRYITLLELFSAIKECEQALENYLNDKKKIFPRFYFLSNDTLLNMLSFGDYPNMINKNVKDCFDGIKEWVMKPKDEKNRSDTVLGMLSSDNDEEVIFDEPYVCVGLVEQYLLKFEEKMRQILREILFKARYNMDWSRTNNKPKEIRPSPPRHLWLNPYPAQIALLVTQNLWTEEVEQAFEELENGLETPMKDYLVLCVKRIDALIDRVKGEELTRDLRAKIITIITVDVHARDVVELFVKAKISEANNFNWKKQLRFKYDFKNQECTIFIADYSIGYSYEYIGNTGRLVITPLTDRCYITLTQALGLILGGAPAGPAGTGKTETTKDLGRNLGLGVIVNNCSEQMDIDTTARIFSGLAQTGFWGCFDEFNRISIEVLSVVSTQVKCVLDAMKEKAKTFSFDGQEIRLVQTVGFFITMNPGYAGRTELPENLKALFRSCAMVVPDLMLICENMLMSEGFKDAKEISRKFITLYYLSRDLLSKQRHYDWGLRAIKSLLRQAGALKRHPLNQSKAEDYIIMKALFDFNKAKIVQDDLPIFKRLLDDLFPGKDKEQEEDTNKELDDIIYRATEGKALDLYKDKNFTLKTRQLFEILGVRHCCFILGAPGSGKTSVWKTLFHTLQDERGQISKYDKLSPKAITSNELLGAFDKNKVWRYGILSSIMKKMCKNDHPYTYEMKNKWVILDGDIDPDWIESLNTVMDDNKVLTLVNGDRFPLSETMRILLEISNMRNATPATVSRGGVLFINETEIGYGPFFEKWVRDNYNKSSKSNNKDDIPNPTHEIIRSVVNILIREFPKTRDTIEGKIVAPIVDIALIQSICKLFKYLIEENKAELEEAEDDRKKLIIECIWYFSYMWAMGGCLKDRKVIHSIIKNALTKIRIPDTGICFDYYFDAKKMQWINWSTKMKEEFEIQENQLFQQIIVPTVEVLRLSYIIEICVREEKPVIFIGDAGTGKTALVKHFLSGIDSMKNNEGYQYKYYTVNFNSYTESYVFQQIIESQIEVRTGTKYAPSGQSKLIYFLDDINMPTMDKYGTQSHVELLRQVLDYKEFYDRKDLELLKTLEDILFIASQNPKAGSFNVDLRLQRHFFLLSTSEPKQEIIKDIYMAILKNHYKNFKFKNGEVIDKLCEDLIKNSVDILESIRKEKLFFPSATKFHYQWNLREISKIIEGMLRTTPNIHKDADQIYRLWYHECNRVFKDRLKFTEDIKLYDERSFGIFDTFKYSTINKKEDITEPFIFVPFDETMEDSDNFLVQPRDFDALKNYCNYKLEEYNEAKAMPLVLFDDAIMHTCRINRIISNPNGHALLVGVGGSGKQSLTRLAAFIKNISIYNIVLTGTDYNREKILEDLKACMKNSCQKPTPYPYVFLLTDNHILEEYFLVYINNFLASSWVDEMYETKQDLENDLNKLVNAAKSEGFLKNNESSLDKVFEFLIYRIKINMHLVLCMSPVGDTLRVRARKFPGILNCTNIDWFHDWPDIALERVAKKNIEELEKFDNDIVIKLSKCTAGIHKSIKDINDLYFSQERRYNYTTPKSYLELIKFFTNIISEKDDQIEKQVARLKKGLSIVKQTGEQIERLKKEIEVKSAEVKIEVESTNAFLVELNAQTEKVNEEKAKVEAATEIAVIETEEAERNEKIANDALKDAIPIKEKAKANARDIDPKQLNEFKNQGSPSENAQKIFSLIYMIFFPKDPKAPELKQIKAKCLNQDGGAIKNALLGKLEEIAWLDADFLKKVEEFRKPPWTDEVFLQRISLPAYKVTMFFHNCCLYKTQYDLVEPLLIVSAAAKKKAAEATAKKDELTKKLNEVTVLFNQLNEKFREKNALKEAKEKEERELKEKLFMAEKFIGLLAGNNKRWGEEVVRLTQFKEKLAGDCLLSSAFVSYIGVFNSWFREKLINLWKSIVTGNDISITRDIDIVRILINDSLILKFKSEGLPADPFSIENSAIMTSCTRWPMIIDPQMQGLKWLRGMTVASKKTIQNKEANWDSKLGNSIAEGAMVILEDIDQDLDPMLTPILGKETVKKDKSSKTSYIKVGTEEYEFNEKCKIYLITKMANPHYKPEVIAQCTLINFIVTEKGLEDQLLALVVNIEAPELEEKIKLCLDEINEYQKELILKEDDVLRRLEEANPETILDNVELVRSLETTKTRATEIEEKSKITEVLIKTINESREKYRRIGEEGAMLYFIISKLFVVQYMYQYSLESFQYFFKKAIDETPKSEVLEHRLTNLREIIRLNIYKWVTSGMFERDKQLFLTMIAIRLIQKGALKDCTDINSQHIEFLLKCPIKDSPGPEKTISDFITGSIWNSMNALSDLPGFTDFAAKMEKEQYNKFKDWFNDINPEDAPLPPDWKHLKISDFKKLLVLRCCRPDRLSIALNEFVKFNIPRGEEFLEARIFMEVLTQAYHDSTPEVPIFFILSPGANPISSLEVLGRSIGKKKFELNKNLIAIAMGQKMDEKAEQYLKQCNIDGHWLFLQNIHLMPGWLKRLQDKLKELAKEKGNDDFRIFLSAEPTKDIPVGILEKSIKLTNEPPSGLKENMKIAFNTIKTENQGEIERKRQALIFALCYFHSVVLERKKFGSLGWNRNYPFNIDDLRNSDSVVNKYLEGNQGQKIPWDDLKYIIGEIMYGGHIVDDWDRRLCAAYMDFLLNDKINEDLDLIPYLSPTLSLKLTLKTPINNQNYPFDKWGEYINYQVNSESPALFGLHPNAELDYRTQQTESLFQKLLDLQPKDSGGGASDDSEASRFESIKADADNYSAEATEGTFNIQGLIQSTSGDDRNPFQNVFIQECDQMRNLCELIKKNTFDIKEAIEGRLTMNEQIENLIECLRLGRVPPKWISEGFQSTRKLGHWITSLKLRIEQYKIFADDPGNPNPIKIVFINRLFNPLSYLTAIKQVYAQTSHLELDKLEILTDPTSISLLGGSSPDLALLKDYNAPIYGLHLQGCRYDEDSKVLEDSKPSENYCVLPVINCKVVDNMVAKLEENKSLYFCPVYKTTQRDISYVFKAQFKTKAASPPPKWIIAGVACILDVDITDNVKFKTK